ncbi:MAG: helix-turn-helix domain-containing protein [Synergistaceae bacterium]|nr:helix-turn-helix domain-containing protein [Synergistaceae bacterium]
MGADRAVVLASIRSFRQEVLNILDRFEDELVALGASHPETPERIQPPDNDDWMTVKQVCEELNISDSTFYGWINAGLLPEGIAFDPRSKN